MWLMPFASSPDAAAPAISQAAGTLLGIMFDGGTEGGGGLEQFVFGAAWADAAFAEIGLNPANPAHMRARRRAEARFARLLASGNLWAYSSSTSGSEAGSEPAEG